LKGVAPYWISHGRILGRGKTGVLWPKKEKEPRVSSEEPPIPPIGRIQEALGGGGIDSTTWGRIDRFTQQKQNK